jgi:hypothetical protein
MNANTATAKNRGNAVKAAYARNVAKAANLGLTVAQFRAAHTRYRNSLKNTHKEMLLRRKYKEYNLAKREIESKLHNLISASRAKAPTVTRPEKPLTNIQLAAKAAKEARIHLKSLRETAKTLKTSPNSATKKKATALASYQANVATRMKNLSITRKNAMELVSKEREQARLLLKAQKDAEKATAKAVKNAEKSATKAAKTLKKVNAAK